MSTREDNATRSMGGKLALWVFYTFCGYFIWAMARCVWLMSAIQTEPVLGPISTPGSATEKWLNALSLGVVWLILGSIAWY
ncbi:cell division protein DrpB, partial [Salmonella enterica]